MNPMGIFGGTFDPIHYAHLRTAFELQQALRLREIRFLPAGNPPHRDQPLADPLLRLKMVQAATAVDLPVDSAALAVPHQPDKDRAVVPRATHPREEPILSHL